MTETDIYRERLRPQFHFTAKKGWLNDPNGLVYHDGEYHLFFQHNPMDIQWGNMTWGHAISDDLIHWKQHPNAIEPYGDGTIFSGSAVADRSNSSGLGLAENPPIVAFFTHAAKPFRQAAAYSTDGGRGWRLYNEGKPVIPNQGMDEGERDPKVFWHEPSGRWIMVFWLKEDTAQFFVSENLLQWEHTSDFTGAGFFECPDLFELPVEGEKNQTRWVLCDAAFNYWVGNFDGRTFTPETGAIRGEYGSAFYATQTWNNVPNRRIQIAWMRGGVYPDMPFNQQMSFPCELSLSRTPKGLRIRRTPIEEIQTLYHEILSLDAFQLTNAVKAFPEAEGSLFDIEMQIQASPATFFGMKIYGHDVRYDLTNKVIRCAACEAPLSFSPEGLLEIRVLVDRTSVEIFGNQGTLSMSLCFVPETNTTTPEIYAEGGEVSIQSLTIRTLQSIWR